MLFINIIIGRFEEIFARVLPFIPSAVDILIFFLWLFLEKKLSLSYRFTLKIFIGLLLLSVLALILNFNAVSQFISEYAFIFFTIGCLEFVFQKHKSQR